MEKTKVLFVCMGNICRSPTAEGVFRHITKQRNFSDIIETDSAGTHAYHVGDPPDRRAQAAALDRGIDISDLRARRVCPEDYEQFDLILAMDRDNHEILVGQSPQDKTDRIKLFLDYAKDVAESEVPDPYYGGPRGFERVFDMIESASEGLLDKILQKNNAKTY